MLSDRAWCRRSSNSGTLRLDDTEALAIRSGFAKLVAPVTEAVTSAVAGLASSAPRMVDGEFSEVTSTETGG